MNLSQFTVKSYEKGIRSQTALWRRVAADPYYIVYPDGKNLILYGTQKTKEYISELFDYLYYHVGYRGDLELRKPGMRIVKSYYKVARKITNIDMCVDMNKGFYINQTIKILQPDGNTKYDCDVSFQYK